MEISTFSNPITRDLQAAKVAGKAANIAFWTVVFGTPVAAAVPGGFTGPLAALAAGSAHLAARSFEVHYTKEAFNEKKYSTGKRYLGRTGLGHVARASAFLAVPGSLVAGFFESRYIFSHVQADPFWLLETPEFLGVISGTMIGIALSGALPLMLETTIYKTALRKELRNLPTLTESTLATYEEIRGKRH